jgi:iron(III) transport system permease protein
VLALGTVVLVPLVILVFLSLTTSIRLGHGSVTLANYSKVFHDPLAWTVFKNTVVFTVGGAGLAVVLGTAMAWAVTSVDLPFRNILRALPLCVLILPALVKDPAWIILFSPTTGLANIVARHLFGIHGHIFNIYSMGGMIAAGGFFTAPLAYVIMLSPFSGIDRSFVEASRASGARLRTTLFRVIIPMIRPALFSAVTLLVIVIASSFETPVLIGLPANIKTYMGQIYSGVESNPLGLNVEAAQGAVYLFLTGAILIFYLLSTRNERRFAAIVGRGHEHALLDAPVLRWVLTAGVVLYALVGFLIPLALIVAVSFLPFYSAVDGNPFHNFTLSNYHTVFTTPEMVTALKTSTILAVTVSLGVVVIGGLLAVIAIKSKSRLRKVCEVIAIAPIAVPHLVFSLGLLLTVLSIPTLAHVFYGTRELMFLSELVIFLPLTMRLLSSALIQLPDELIEASLMSRAGMLRTVRSIVLPILRPALLYVAAVVFILSYRELGAIVLLAAANTTVLPYVSLTAWVSGGYTQLAALNVIILGLPLVVVGVVVLLSRTRSRRPARKSPASGPAVAG